MYMKYVKLIINFFINGNVSNEHYEIAQNDMYANNVIDIDSFHYYFSHFT